MTTNKFTNAVNAPKPMDEQPKMFCTQCRKQTAFKYDKVIKEVATGDDLYIFYCETCDHPVYIIK